MLFLNTNRALLQGILASALVLGGTAACSRPDRTESGTDNSAAIMQDTIGTAPANTTTTATATDTAAGTITPESGAATGDTAPAQIQRDAPRAATATPSAELQDTSLEGDSVAAGYRPMERDTVAVPESDSARITGDTSNVSGDTTVSSADTAGPVSADTVSVESAGAAEISDTASVSVAIDTAVDTSATVSDTISLATDTSAMVSDTGFTEMARDTSTTADQIDTTGAAVSGEVAVDTSADRSWTDSWTDEAVDTSTTAAQTDTTGAAVSGDVALEASVDTTRADTGVTAGADVSADADLAVAADTADNAGRIRPPEDSTEILGEVTTTNTAEVATADTLESDRIRPPEDSTELQGVGVTDETADEQEINAEDREVVSAESATDEVGAAAVAVTVTGAEAVALVTRQGTTCIIVDPERNEEVRWDMSSTPVTLNPCGLGSMNLSKTWTSESERQE